jgi:hypothetical protein
MEINRARAAPSNPAPLKSQPLISSIAPLWRHGAEGPILKRQARTRAPPGDAHPPVTGLAELPIPDTETALAR